MKEMSTITFPNKSEPYEVVDAAARSDISDLTTNLTNNYETKTDSAAKLAEAKGLIDGKADSEHDHEVADVAGLQTALNGKAASEHSHGFEDVNIILHNSTTSLPAVVEGAILVCYDA